MPPAREADACALRDFGALLTECDQALIVGAPGIGKSTRLDQLASEPSVKVYRDHEDFPGGSHAGTVVLDDFYDQFTWYRTADSEDRKAYREAVKQQIESNGSLFVCTTPYRLQWMLERHRNTFDELLGGLAEDWTVEPIQVDHDDARSFLTDRLDESVSVQEYEDEIEWCYQFEDAFGESLYTDEQYQDIFGDIREYRTLVPGILTAAGSDAALRQALSDRESVLSSFRWMLRDVSASGAMSGGSSLIDGAREYAQTLDASGALNAVKSAIGTVVPDSAPDVPSEAFGAGVGAAGAVLSGPALAVGCIGYWAWATRKADEATRETVRKEFGRILGSDVLELPPVDREDLEAELGLEPKTLLYLNEAASGASWEKVERAMEEMEAIKEDLDATIDRVDEVESTVADHDAVIETLISRLELIGARPGYMTLWEFEADLYDRPEYVSPGYREPDAREHDPFFGSTPTEGENAPARLLDIVTADSPSITTVVGESGIGKSRLLAEVGRELQDCDDVETWYVRNPGEFTEPLYESDTVVVFLDEAGSMEHIEQFFELASGNWREFGVDCTVHVVAALRPVYQDKIERIDIPNTERNEIELRSLDEDGTVSLLSDTSVTAETARRIYETAEGNPFLSRLLAVAEEAGDDVSRSPEEKIRDIIDKNMLKEFDEPEQLKADAEVMRRLLKAIAILGRYDPEVAQRSVIETCEIRGERKHNRLLPTLRNINYLTAEGGTNTTDRDVYAHRIDVFAEYLRLQAMGDQHDEWYDDLIAAVPLESLPGIARGLAELDGTTLQRFSFFPVEKVKSEIKQRLEIAARRAVNKSGEIADVIRVQAYVARVDPSLIPREDLESRYTESKVNEEAAEELVYFFTSLYQYPSRADVPKHKAVSSKIMAWQWLGRLSNLSKSHHDNAKIDFRLAQALTNAIGYEGEPAAIQQRLDQLEELVEAHPNNVEIHAVLAKALFNATFHEFNAGRYKAIQQRITRLEELVETHPDNAEIHLEFAKVLTNVIYADGEAGQFNTVQQRIGRLEELVGTNPDNVEIHFELAKALVNATDVEGKAERFNTVQQRLDRLDELVKNYPENNEIYFMLAQALTNAILYEGRARLFNLVQQRLTRLEELADTHPDNAEIHLELAKSLFHVTTHEAEAERFEAVQQRLARLEELVETHPDNADIHLKLANTLVNVINMEGETKSFNSVQQRLDRLEELAETYSNSDEIHLQLAKALVNATLHESKAGLFDSVQQRLNRLEELADTYPNSDEIHLQLAKALVNATDGEGEVGQFNTVQQRLDRLENLVETHPDNAEIHSELAYLLKNTGEDLLRAGRLTLLEQLLTALRTGLSEARIDSVCTDLVMTVDELFRKNQIDMDTYTRAATLCED